MKKFINYISRSLNARIFLITALILVAACGITYAFIAWATPISYVSITNNEMKQHTEKLLSELQNAKQEEGKKILERFTRKAEIKFRIVDFSGVTFALVGGEENFDKLKDIEQEVFQEYLYVTKGTGAKYSNGGVGVIEEFISSDVIETQKDSDVATDEYLTEGSQSSDLTIIEELPEETAIMQVFLFQDSEDLFLLEAVSTVTKVNKTTEALAHVLPFLIPVVLIISFVGGLIYSSYITKPIVRLCGISKNMAELDFTWKCPANRRDEIGSLGEHMNIMSERLSTALLELKAANLTLEQDIERERETERQRMTFFYAASHELKTPITVLKGQISGMLAGIDIYQDRDKYLARSLSVTGRMERLVQEMLSITRMENAGFLIKKEKLNLSELLRTQLEQAEDQSKLREQQLFTKIEKGITIKGDAALLNRAICSLLANAISYSPEQETIRVFFSTYRENYILTIENSGIQIPEEALPHLFEAFYRVEASRSRETGGSGLGLYLVKMILDRHQADCTIENTENAVKVTVNFSMKNP